MARTLILELSTGILEIVGYRRLFSVEITGDREILTLRRLRLAGHWLHLVGSDCCCLGI